VGAAAPLAEFEALDLDHLNAVLGVCRRSGGGAEKKPGNWPNPALA
jgi:hypothetical protein